MSPPLADSQTRSCTRRRRHILVQHDLRNCLLPCPRLGLWPLLPVTRVGRRPAPRRIYNIAPIMSCQASLTGRPQRVPRTESRARVRGAYHFASSPESLRERRPCRALSGPEPPVNIRQMTRASQAAPKPGPGQSVVFCPIRTDDGAAAGEAAVAVQVVRDMSWFRDDRCICKVQKCNLYASTALYCLYCQLSERSTGPRLPVPRDEGRTGQRLGGRGPDATEWDG